MLKKKMTALSLLGILGVGSLFGTPTSASTQEVTRTEGTDGIEATVPMNGYIGPENESYFDPTTLVQVSVPTQIDWYATEVSEGVIQAGQLGIESPEYMLKNTSEYANLKVKITSFTPQSGSLLFSDLPGELNLELVTEGKGGEEAERIGLVSDSNVYEDIENGDRGEFYYPLYCMIGEQTVRGGDAWQASHQWELGMDGSYRGNIPTSAFHFKYNLNFAFEIDSYEANGE